MWKKYFAEFFGTFCLVLFGCGTAMMYSNTLQTALAFGLVIIAMAYSMGKYSGGHFNPAVTVANMLTEDIDIKTGCLYIVCQFVGAIAGGFLLAKMMPGATSFNGIYNNNVFETTVLECIMTAVFVGVIFAVRNEKFGGIVIGLTLTLIHLLMIGFDGCSVNPARSLASAIFDGKLNTVWVFFVGPLMGAVFAAFMHEAFTYEKEDKQK